MTKSIIYGRLDNLSDPNSVIAEASQIEYNGKSQKAVNDEIKVQVANLESESITSIEPTIESSITPSGEKTDDVVGLSIYKGSELSLVSINTASKRKGGFMSAEQAKTLEELAMASRSPIFYEEVGETEDL